MNNENLTLPTACSLLVSEDCNLRCKYCFELGEHHHEFMTIETTRAALEYLFKNQKYLADNNMENSGTVDVTLFCGEPLLNPDSIEEVCKYGLELSKKYECGFSVGTITNGTIMNERIFNIYSKYKKDCNMSVQISVDGIKEAHDENRVTVSGKGSFDMIEKNLPKWKQLMTNDNGFLQGLCIHGCISPGNIKYFYDSYRYFRDVWNVNYIWFMPIHDAYYSIDDVKLYREVLIKIAEELVNECISTGSLKPINDYAPLDKAANGRINPCNLQKPGIPCGAGKNYVTITAAGNISPCHHIYFSKFGKDTIIGNIYDGVDPLRNILMHSYDTSDFSCEDANPECNCSGCYRCMADNWVRNGSIFEQIRGERCMMSHIERDIQVWIHNELKKAGFFDQQEG